MNRRNVHGWLMEEIELHLMIGGETEREFCLRATGNPDLMNQMREKKNPRIDTVQRVLDAIDGVTVDA